MTKEHRTNITKQDINKKEKVSNRKEIIDLKGNIHTVEVIMHPTKMDSEAQGQLVSELTPVTGRGFLRKDIHSQELYNDVAQHVIDCERLIVIRNKDEVSLFIAASIKKQNGVTIYHLEGIIVEPEFHGTGLAYIALKNDIEVCSAKILAFHTQSLRMFRLGQKLADITEQESLKYASLINTRNQQGVVDVARYGGQSLYENIVEFAHQAIPNLNFKNGDALICAGFVKK